MATLEVLTWPNPALQVVADPVTTFDAALAQLVADMFETMEAEGGVGLAATQVGVPLRVLVMDCGPRGDGGPAPLAVINPQITRREGRLVWNEGCLSVPGVQADVERDAEITVAFVDVTGAPQTLALTELEAVCLQHEVDHLDGRLYIDRLGPLERRVVLKDYAERGEAEPAAADTAAAEAVA